MTPVVFVRASFCLCADTYKPPGKRHSTGSTASCLIVERRETREDRKKNYDDVMDRGHLVIAFLAWIKLRPVRPMPARLPRTHAFGDLALLHYLRDRSSMDFSIVST